MFGAGRSSDGGNIRRPIDSDRYLRNIERLDRDSGREEVQKAEKGIADALRVRPFIIQQRLPFFQRVAQALRGRNAFQEFRLTDGKVVVDKRDKEAETAKQQVVKEVIKDMRDAASARESESRKETEQAKYDGRIRDGKFVRDKSTADATKSVDKSLWGKLEQQTASDRVDKLLSKFERMILQRFEEGSQIAQQSKDGKPAFAEKSDGQWSQFFRQFLDRTVKKTIDFSKIQEFLFRGLVAKGNRGIFIGDLKLTSGQVEKFIRMSIMESIMARLKGLKPGQAVGKGAFGELGEELAYLALSSAKRKQYSTSDKEAEGKFMGGRAEDRAAKELGITLDDQLREKARKMRKGRGLNWFFEKDPEGEDIPYTFVPWWHWGNLSKPGKFKWFTVFFYSSLLILAIMGIAIITMKFLP